MAGIGTVTAVAWDTYAGEAYQGHSTVQFKADFNETISTYSIKVGNEIVVNGNGGIFAPLVKNICHYLKTDNFSNQSFPKITFTATFGSLFDKKTTETMTITPNVYVRAYFPPTVSKGLVFRSDDNGDVNDEGKYVTANLNFKISSIYSRTNRIEKILIYTKLRSDEVKDFELKKTISPGANPSTFGGAFDTERGYDIKIEFEDTLGGKGTYIDYVTTGLVALSLHQNSAAAFGKSVEKNDGLELAEKWNLYLHESAYVDKNIALGGSITVGGDINVLGNINAKDNALYVIEKNNRDLFKIDNLSNGDSVMVKFVAFKNSTYDTVCDDTVLIFKDSQGYMRHTRRNYNPDYEPNFSLYAVESGRVVSFGSTSNYTEKIYYKIYDSVINSKTAKLTLFGTKV